MDANQNNADPEAVPHGDPADGFLMKELELLRMSVENEVEELRKLDRWVLVTTAAVWTWILTDPTRVEGLMLRGIPVVLFVPLFIVLIFGLKTTAINQSLDLTSDYLRECVESRIGPQCSKCHRRTGFETYFHRRNRESSLHVALIRKWAWSYYAVLFVGYLGLALWGMREFRSDDPQGTAAEAPGGSQDSISVNLEKEAPAPGVGLVP